jgi:hypothetical protein
MIYSLLIKLFSALGIWANRAEHWTECKRKKGRLLYDIDGNPIGIITAGDRTELF